MNLKAVLTAERNQFDLDIAIKSGYRFMGWTTQERRMNEKIKEQYGKKGEEDSIRSLTADFAGYAFMLLTPVAIASLVIYNLLN